MATVNIFDATRKELWNALVEAKATGDCTWKQSDKKQMIKLAVKADIEEVLAVSDDSEMLKKLTKSFTPAFFKNLREVEALLAQIVETVEPIAVDIEDSDDLVEADTVKKN